LFVRRDGVYVVRIEPAWQFVLVGAQFVRELFKQFRRAFRSLRFEGQFHDRLQGIGQLVAGDTGGGSGRPRTEDFFFGFDCGTHFKNGLPDDINRLVAPPD
jgi:hypothetical protein